jgi:hypothetical protein
MIELPITPDDIAQVTPVAIAKGEYSEHHGFVPCDKPARIERGQQHINDMTGCLGELKCSQFFGLPFDTSENATASVDCKIIEVRARRIETGRDLAIRPHDKMRLPYVLVWLDHARMIATIVGWLCGWEAHQRAMQAKLESGRDVWWQPLKSVWFIPPPYHSIESIKDWILIGHPLHWAPEEYR